MNTSDIPSAWKGHEPFARWMVQMMQPKVTVELGVDYGYSLIELALFNRTGTVYGIDAFEGDDHAGHRDVEAEARRNIEDSGCGEWITLIRSRFDEALKNWTLPINLLHIDGRHGYEDVKHDFGSWFPHVVPGGVILLHDTRSFPDDVGRFFRELPYLKWEFEHSHGLGVVVKP